MILPMVYHKTYCNKIKHNDTFSLFASQFFKSPRDKKVGKTQAGCLCLGLFRVLKKSGLGESFGKASLANTAFGLGRFISMRDRSSWTEEGWYRYASETWPDEASERGLPRPLARRGKNWGWASFSIWLTA